MQNLDAAWIGAEVLTVEDELNGLLLLDGAPTPQGDDGDERGDGPAASAKCRLACAYFAVDEAEESRGDQCNEKDDKDGWLEDEDERGCVPVRTKGKKGRMP